MGGGAAPSPPPPSSFIISKKEINPSINRSTDQCGCLSGSLSSFSFLSFRSQKTPWGEDLQFQSGVFEVFIRAVSLGFAMQSVCSEVRFCEKSRVKHSFW